MQPLTPEKLLAVWETGRPQHALDRALTILAAATPGANREALADLTIGERDTFLLQLRTLVLGSRAEGFAECPSCGERIEFPIDTAAFTPPPEERAPARPATGSQTVTQASSLSRRAGFQPGACQPAGRMPAGQDSQDGCVTLRSPTSRDLALVATARDDQQALRILLERCGVKSDSPNESMEAVSRAILEQDPQAEITLALQCPVCAHRWDLLFDIVEFFWTEISAQAQRLLREIDTLARAYGWTEREILSLTAQRRQTYLEQIAA